MQSTRWMPMISHRSNNNPRLVILFSSIMRRSFHNMMYNHNEDHHHHHKRRVSPPIMRMHPVCVNFRAQSVQKLWTSPLESVINSFLFHNRFFTSNSSPNQTISLTPTQQTQSFLRSLGYSEEISNGIIDALVKNGISHTSLLSMVKGLAGRYEVGEDGGLETLAASVKLELEKLSGKKMITFWCVPSTGWSPTPDTSVDQQLPVIHSMDRAFAVETTVGTTLYDVVKFGTNENSDVLGEYLECACSGIMACSTCHVVIHPDWFDDATTTLPSSRDDPSKKIGPPSEAEQDMIDLAYEPQLTSRLGCQIRLTQDLDGLVILLPRGSNNLMDDIPFE